MTILLTFSNPDCYGPVVTEGTTSLPLLSFTGSILGRHHLRASLSNHFRRGIARRYAGAIFLVASRFWNDRPCVVAPETPMVSFTLPLGIRLKDPTLAELRCLYV